MRIVVMGTGPFAVPMFAAILAAGHQVPLLVTRPVPPATGRDKQKRQPNPMRDFAEARGIPVLAPETTKSPEIQAELAALQPDLFVVCDFGEILSSETLALAPLGGINLHASLLPKFRGAAPINWAILRGEQETGISVIHMTPKLDGGPILTSAITQIGQNETTAELEPRLAQLGVQPVLQAIEMLQTWDRTQTLGAPQEPQLVTSARRLRKTDAEVIWNRTATRIRNQVRGLKPWPGVFSYLHRPGHEPLRLILDWVEIVPQEACPATFATSPGMIVCANEKQLWVQTGQGCISLERVQPAGKKVMQIRDFLRGNPIPAASKFGPIAAAAD